MANLPNVESAVVPERKLTSYLLDLTHPDGGPKARFLFGFGFSSTEPALLRAALVNHLRSNDISEQRTTDFGDIIEIVGPLTSPDGHDPIVRTVWIIPEGALPRFVTLVPDHTE